MSIHSHKQFVKFSIINQFLPGEPRDIVIQILVNGNVHSESQTICQIFNHFFYKGNLVT